LQPPRSVGKHGRSSREIKEFHAKRKAARKAKKQHKWTQQPKKNYTPNHYWGQRQWGYRRTGRLSQPPGKFKAAVSTLPTLEPPEIIDMILPANAGRWEQKPTQLAVDRLLS